MEFRNVLETRGKFSFAVDHPDFSVGSREGAGQRAVSHNMRGVVQPAAAARRFDGAAGRRVGPIIGGRRAQRRKITWVFYLKRPGKRTGGGPKTLLVRTE